MNIIYGKNFKYQKNTRGNLTCIGFNSSFHNPKANLTIPATVKGIDVDEIAPRAFYASSLIAGIVVGENVTCIGDEAFAESWVTNVCILGSGILDKKVAIGQGAFARCKRLTAFTSHRPASVNWSCFSNCQKLKDVNAFIYEFSPNAFEYCYGLQRFKFKYPNAKISCSSTYLLHNTHPFSYCNNLQELIIEADFVCDESFVVDVMMKKKLKISSHSEFLELAYQGADVELI